MTRPPELFVGRTRELAILCDLAEAARRGEPRVALIEGAGGSGKSALLRAFSHVNPDFCLLTATADEFGANVPMSLLGQLVDSQTDAAMVAGLDLLSLLGERQLAGPVALLVEDLHWADAVSGQALLTALRRLDRGDRVLVAVTARAGGFEALARLDDRSERVRWVSVGALTVDDIVEYAGLLDTPLTKRSAQAVHDHTAGHALYVATILRQLTPGRLNVDGRLPVPRSLAASTLAMVAQLEPEAQRFVTALCVLGSGADVDTVAEVAGLADATGAVDDAATAGLIVVSEAGRGGQARFTHPLYRTVVYDDLSPSRRRRLHVAAADALTDGVQSLLHRVAAVDRADDALALEAERAVAGIDDIAIAYDLLVAAGDVSTQPDVQRRSITTAARRAMAVGNVAMVDKLRDRLRVHGSAGERDLVFGWLAWQRADVPEAERLLRSAGGPTNTADERARALLQLSSMYALQSRGAEAIEAASAAIAEQALSARDEERAHITIIRGIAQAEGGVKALAALAERFPDPWPPPEQVDPYLVRARALMHLFAGQPAQSLPWFDAAIAMGTRADMVEFLAHLHHSRAHAHFRCGSWDDALLDAHQAIELALDLDQRWVLSRAHAVATWVQSARGQIERADAHLRQVQMLPVPDDSHEVRMIHAMAEASVAHAQGNMVGVIAALGPLAADGGELLPGSESLQFWPTLIRALLDTGRVDEAAEQLAALGGAAHERRIDVAMQITALTGRLEAARGDASGALVELERAVGLITSDTDAIERAELFQDHGRLLLRLGRRRPAAERFATARSIYAALAADPYIERLDEERGEGDVRQEARRDRTRFDLTDRERDVAALVVRGMTNREIASNLYVSKKAVEYHLGNIYAKLGIRSRHRLAAVLGG